MSVIQIPLVAGIIASYGFDDNMAQLTWQYAIGIMIATPFGLVFGRRGHVRVDVLQKRHRVALNELYRCGEAHMRASNST